METNRSFVLHLVDSFVHQQQLSLTTTILVELDVSAISDCLRLGSCSTIQGLRRRFEGEYYTVADERPFQKIQTKVNRTLRLYARLGSLDGVKFISSRNVGNRFDYNQCMTIAAEHGHIDIVQFCLDCGARGYNPALNGAALYGHMEIAQLMIQKGATDFATAIKYASIAGNAEMIEFLKSKMV